MARATTVKDSDTLRREDWAGTAGSIVTAIALAPDNFSKEGIVEALQELALKMDGELVAESTLRIMMGVNKMGGGF